MHQAVLRSGARLVVMTLPPFNCQMPGRLEKQYTQLNNGLRQRFAALAAGDRSDEASSSGSAQQEVAAGRGVQHHRAVLVDLQPLFPIGDALLWCDDLHLKPAGYNKMAEAIFDGMQPQLLEIGLAGAEAAAVAGGDEQGLVMDEQRED